MHVEYHVAPPNSSPPRQNVRYSIGLPSCAYCSAAPKGAWVFTEFVVAIPHPHPLATGHLIVAPRRHVAAFFDLDVQEQHMIWDAISQLCRRITASTAVESFDAGFVDAAAADDLAFHTYVHLVPRIRGQRVSLPRDAEWADLGPRP